MKISKKSLILIQWSHICFLRENSKYFWCFSNRFPNDPCTGESKNGTCYTTEECNQKGGTRSGSCAQGYGVCCTCKLLTGYIILKL